MDKKLPKVKECQCKYCESRKGRCRNPPPYDCANKYHTYHPIITHWIRVCQSCNENKDCYGRYSEKLYKDNEKREPTIRSPRWNGENRFIRIVRKMGSTWCNLAYINLPLELLGKLVTLILPDGCKWTNIPVKKDNGRVSAYRSVKLLPYIGQEITVVIQA